MLAYPAGGASRFSAATGPFFRSQCRRLTPPRSSAVASRRLFSVTRSAAELQQKPKSVAVLGGGITGLSAAWYLSKFAPSVPVTLYEKSPRLGGWLNTKRVDYDGGSVLFEQGPRTLRPWTVSGLVTLDMIRQLGLEDEISTISNSSPAAINRFIYYPDRLNQLPFNVPSALLSLLLPVMKGIPSGIIREPFQKQRPLDLQDESVASFFSRRFNSKIAQNLISSVLHGIYAGDIDRLSAKTLFPKFWKAEADHGSLIVGLLKKHRKEVLQETLLENEIRPDIRQLLAKLDGTNVYSFKDGIETLSRALEAELHKSPNVTIKTSTEIPSLRYSPQDPEFPFGIPGTAKKYSHVISTLYAPVTNSLLPEKLRIPTLAQIEAVTVLVVNLYFASPNLLPVEGFGYLLPKSLSDSENPHKALGVIFDSHSTPQPSEKGTKLTVMLGGHHWTGRTSYPSDSEAVEMARDVLRQHLGIEEIPIATNVALNRNCIPQPNVGHDERIKNIKSALLENFSGRLGVVGSSYRGVGLNDCVRSARDVVKGMLKEGKYTGLEGLGDETEWVEVAPRK